MANLLLDADLWASQSGGPPPAEWTGERYEFLNASTAQSSLTLQSAAPASSTIAGTLNPTVLGAEGPYALVITASTSGELFREILTEGVPVEFDAEVPEGETAELRMTHDPGGNSTPYSFEITITPAGPPPPADRKITVAISKDGGHNYGNQREAPLGELGAYRQRVRFRRFGKGRQFVMKIRVTSPIKADLMDSVVDFEVAS